MPAPRLTLAPRDRLGLMLFVAGALHALLIFGLDFRLEQPGPQPPPTLEITLVRTHAPAPPAEADYLAPANQEGGGERVEKVRPTRPAPPVEQAPVTAEAAVPPAPVEQRPAAPPRGSQIVTAPAPAPPAPEPEPVSAAQLYARGMALADLTAELDEPPQTRARQPRQKYISARTREYKYAAYMDAWVRKVERVGNLNYPDAARREGLSGDLILDVVLNADGSVRDIAVLRPSGHRVLDEAAVRIVELAAPFAPFPEDIRKEADILHITRTWQFLDGARLLGR